jgi:probable addiction module antidote protein
MTDICKITHRRWNILEELDSEEEIDGFLDAAIEESDGDTAFILLCVADIAKARLINHVTKETGIDRKLLCDMFLEDVARVGKANGSYEAINANSNAVLKAAREFTALAHA